MLACGRLRMRAVPTRRHWLPRNASMASRVDASLPKEGVRSGGSESCCLTGRAGCPVRALRSAAGRRLHLKSTRVRTLRSFLVGANWRETRAALSILLEQAGRARANRHANQCGGSAGRTGPGISPGRLFPTARGMCAARRARRPWSAYLENLPQEPHSSEASAAGGAASFRGTDMVPYLE